MTLSPKQQQVLVELENLDHHPTVRSMTDHLETRVHRSERWTDNEVHGLLERLREAGYVSKYRDKKKAVRYQPVGDSEPDPAA